METFGAMAAMFVLALSVPEAFDDLLGGLNGPVVLAIAYLAVRLLHLAIFWLRAVPTAGAIHALACCAGLRARSDRVSPATRTATYTCR